MMPTPPTLTTAVEHDAFLAKIQAVLLRTEGSIRRSDLKGGICHVSLYIKVNGPLTDYEYSEEADHRSFVHAVALAAMRIADKAQRHIHTWQQQSDHLETQRDQLNMLLTYKRKESLLAMDPSQLLDTPAVKVSIDQHMPVATFHTCPGAEESPWPALSVAYTSWVTTLETLRERAYKIQDQLHTLRSAMQPLIHEVSIMPVSLKPPTDSRDTVPSPSNETVQVPHVSPLGLVGLHAFVPTPANELAQLIFSDTQRAYWQSAVRTIRHKALSLSLTSIPHDDGYAVDLSIDWNDVEDPVTRSHVPKGLSVQAQGTHPTHALHKAVKELVDTMSAWLRSKHQVLRTQSNRLRHVRQLVEDKVSDDVLSLALLEMFPSSSQSISNNKLTHFASMHLEKDGVTDRQPLLQWVAAGEEDLSETIRKPIAIVEDLYNSLDDMLVGVPDDCRSTRAS